jgi:dTDP-4-dehydrorhamnose reductase
MTTTIGVEKMAKHLVIGSRGLVGSALVRELMGRKQKVYEFAPCYRIENQAQVWNTTEFVQPDVIWLAAGYTNVTKAQTDPRANTANIDGVANVVDAARAFGSKVVFFSTSYIFDGDNEFPYDVQDEPNPLSKYGAQKVVGERLVENLEDYCIIRTCAVYGHDVNRKCFPYYVLDRLSVGEKVLAPVDQIVCPIHVNELARLAVHASKLPPNIYHINGPEPISKHDWAVALALGAGLTKELIVPTRGDPIRPGNATMVNSFYTQSFSKGMWEFIDDYEATNN